MGIKEAHKKIISQMNLLMERQRADYQQILKYNLEGDKRQDLLNSIHNASHFFDGLESAAEIIEEECPEVLEESESE